MKRALSKEGRERLGRDLVAYVKTELDCDITGLEAALLLDFLAARLGPEIYNQALADAQDHLRVRLEGLAETLVELEQPAPPRAAAPRGSGARPGIAAEPL